MTAPVPAYAIALAERALDRGRVVIYAGAGISMAQPTGLPSGSSLASTIYAKLGTVFPSLNGVDQNDLLAVADAVVALPGGADALRQTAAHSAEFRTAKPSFGHRLIAYLVLEGLIDILTTNWDDCIERGGESERLQAVADQASLESTSPPSVLKVHGCATQPSTLLITTAELQDPPRWAKEQTHARLGSATVVFLGIGDIADYVRSRIEEAIVDAGGTTNIRVVSPSIVSEWDASPWSSVAPDLADEHRIAATSDQFMEQLGAAYVHVIFKNHVAALSENQELATNLSEAVAALHATNALALLKWARHAAHIARPGESVLRTERLAEALTALGKLAGRSIKFNPNQIFETNDGPIEILVATGTVAATQLERDARNRLAEHAAQGVKPPRFIVAGGMGWFARGSALPDDVMNERDPSDIVDGPDALTPEILLAHEVLAS